MSTLIEAQQALIEAKANAARAATAAAEARSKAAQLRARVAGGDGKKVGPSDLAAADQAAEHADLVAEGATAPLAELHDTVRSLEQDQECDQITVGLTERAQPVCDALAALEAPLAAFIAAAREYDAFADHARRRVKTVLSTGHPRVKAQQHGDPRVDGIPIRGCRPASQLAQALLPAMAAVGAPSFTTSGLSLLAEAAHQLPTA